MHIPRRPAGLMAMPGAESANSVRENKDQTWLNKVKEAAQLLESDSQSRTVAAAKSQAFVREGSVGILVHELSSLLRCHELQSCGRDKYAAQFEKARTGCW